MNLRKLIVALVALVGCTFSYAQKVALKNNLLMDGMASPNLGVEFRTGARTSLEIPVSANLWSFSDTKKFKHIALQPEFRWWTCQPFAGHFFGIHAHYASFNVGGIDPFDTIKKSRYEGWLTGGGLTYGYTWILAPRWSLEASVGAGYTYFSYDKFPCGKCQPRSYHKNKHYLGPTKAALTLVFMIK